MRDLIGYIKKTVLIFSLILLATNSFIPTLFANTKLSTKADFSHTLRNNELIETTITFNISSSSTTVLAFYTITIPQTNIKPEIYIENRAQRLEATLYNRPNSTDILIDLENSILTENSPIVLRLTYTHKYEDKNIFNLISEVTDTPTSSISITYPRDWGETDWISDQISDMRRTDDYYILKILNPNSRVVKLIFNQGIVYRFNISKSLNNPTDQTNQYELIIPPDNNFQRVVIEEINQIPSEALLDENNNYVLIFTIPANTQQDIKIEGYIIMGYRDYGDDPILITQKRNDIYWILEQRHIRRVNEYLQNNGIERESIDDRTLIEYLYRYVVERLTPSTLPTTLAGGVRRNAMDVFDNPDESTPENYADLLKALLYNYEIPTIYNIGYISEIGGYQQSGMFHHWVTVHDGNSWIILDPYLEDKYKVSLFGREKLDHITILNRSTNSISPTLPYYSDNDIRFEYVQDSEINTFSDGNFNISLEPFSILNKYIYGKIIIENTGNTIFTDILLQDCQPDLNKYLDNVINSVDTILLPKMSNSLYFHIPFNEIDEETMFCSISIQNGEETILSKLVSTEYQIVQRSTYQFWTKLISFILFLLFSYALYLFIDKIVYKDE